MKKIISILLICIITIGLSSCGKSTAELKKEDIHAICELATIKCYYNNVAKIEKEKDNIFQKERKMWIEYEGVASIGIDMSEIKTKIVGKTVTITMPKAKVLSIGINKETLNQKSYVYSSDGIIFKNKITTEEQEEGIKKGQETMQKTIEGNTNLFVQAESRAKELIENYINKLGDIGGVVYTINWK